MEMLKMVPLFHLFLFGFLGLTAAGQEYFEYNVLYETTPEFYGKFPEGSHPFAVPVNVNVLSEVSGSLLTAESWLRTHVLAHYPSTPIRTIFVEGLLCQNGKEQNLGLVLPSLKNLYHSLSRWGLQKDIKVSVAISSVCFHQNPEDIYGNGIESVVEFLHFGNSTFSIYLPPKLSSLSYGVSSLPQTHQEIVKKLEPFMLKRINLIVPELRERQLTARKLSVKESRLADPFTARPAPIPEISPSSIHSSIGSSVPATVPKSPQSPEYPSASPPLSFPVSPPEPPLSFSASPELPPLFVPSIAPYGPSLPPCSPAYSTPPAPEIGMVPQKLWCVAKPHVSEENLQEAMDYACGEGGADCREIMPSGSCFYPDTVIAHASYAFNSYWQKNKRNGGTCSFGGTAMIINSDPSFLQCHFVRS